MWVWRYELSSASALNAVSERKSFHGALVREDSGFACVHPWPELGDPSLDECLNDLTASPLGRQTLKCLEFDGAAREASVSLFDGVEVPESHATVVALNEEVIQKLRAQGFTHVKVKATLDHLGAIQSFVRAHTDLKWRLDFNGQGRPQMFRDWSAEERACLDFVEDPFPYDATAWGELGVTTAVDRCEGEAEVRILKPAVDELILDSQKTSPRTVMTSYMDHPFGQSFASWASASCLEVCGLQTHHLFEKNVFIEALGESGPTFHPAEGTGLGFDDLLEKLPWKKL